MLGALQILSNRFRGRGGWAKILQLITILGGPPVKFLQLKLGSNQINTNFYFLNVGNKRKTYIVQYVIFNEAMKQIFKLGTESDS